MLILALDTSLSKTGGAIIRITEGELVVIETFSIVTNSNYILGNRLNDINDYLQDVLNEYDFDLIVREDFHLSSFANAAQKQFSVVGVVEMLSYINGLDIFMIKPSVITKLITGQGRPPKGTRKKIVREALPRFIGEFKIRNYDESDAIAVGVGYALQKGLLY